MHNLYRYPQELEASMETLCVDIDSEWIKEDENAEKTRDVTDPGFYARYDMEADLIAHLMEKHGAVKNVLELGCGPGFLAQKIMDRISIPNYDLVDGPGAKAAFNRRKYKGNFYAQDMMNNIDMEPLKTDYDFVIINDFLEHVRNPSIILSKIYNVFNNKSKLFISVPNWRMGHTFFYPGLFDYDNFYKFVEIHGFEYDDVFGSGKRIQCSMDKLDSETCLPDALVQSWNWYFIFSKP